MLFLLKKKLRIKLLYNCYHPGRTQKGDRADLRYHYGMTTFRSILGSIRADFKIKFVQEHEEYLNKL